jgi:hypothetical protein
MPVSLESSQGSGVPVPAGGVVTGVAEGVNEGGDEGGGVGVYAGLVGAEPDALGPVGRGRQRRPETVGKDGGVVGRVGCDGVCVGVMGAGGDDGSPIS